MPLTAIPRHLRGRQPALHLRGCDRWRLRGLAAGVYLADRRVALQGGCSQAQAGPAAATSSPASSPAETETGATAAAPRPLLRERELRLRRRRGWLPGGRALWAPLHLQSRLRQRCRDAGRRGAPGGAASVPPEADTDESSRTQGQRQRLGRFRIDSGSSSLHSCRLRK